MLPCPRPLDLAGSELFDTTDLDDSQALVGIAKALIDRLLRHTESQIDLTLRGQHVDKARIHEVERNLLLDALKLADVRCLIFPRMPEPETSIVSEVICGRVISGAVPMAFTPSM